MAKITKNEEVFTCKENCGGLFTEDEVVLFDGMYFYNEDNTVFIRSTRESSKYFTKIMENG